ncbi:fungal-specific transcription factor domain-containing protein [Mycena latifolia]|nr:fungal-specific transcription factor domain-containing protein [Mycena latifolia]
MSSEGTLLEGTKKRRLRGACDICRRQKIRCDSAKMPGNRCSNCVAFNSECTHNLSQLKEEKGPRRKRATNAPPKSVGEETPMGDSIRVLETAKNVVDGLLSQTPNFRAPEDREALLQLLLEVARYARSLEQELDVFRSQTSPSDRTGSTSVSPSAVEPDAEGESGVVIDLQKLPAHLRRVTADTADHRFFGNNSSIRFVQTAIEETQPQDACHITPSSRRPEFWTPHPWEASPDPPVALIFPPDDLLRDLVEIYFTQLNIFWAILHRPTFAKSIVDGLHLRDNRFGATVLAVCALASKNSPDKRVLVPDTQGEISAGWNWFRQIRRPFSGPVVKTASLYELQLCCLYIMFQQTGSDLESCWILSGIGILHAQDIGIHRRPDQNEPLELEQEMLKRCFFFLSTFDAIVSACFGRPRVLQASEYDLDHPVACDDEYLEHLDREKPFKQPPGKPSRVDYVVAYIKLIEVFTFSWLKKGSYADYTGKKPLDAETIAELDSRLNQWAEEIPEHLLWNPYMQDDVFFDQSATLYASYYHVQILVHRPFMRTRATPPSSSTFKSLAICANAARSCSHVVDVKSRRGPLPSAQFLKAAFDSAIVLLLNISGGTQSGLSIDTGRELVDVYKCMTLLRQSEQRWQNAGRFYDILCELLNGSNLPFPPVASPEVPLTPWIGNSSEGKPTSDIPLDGRAQNPELWPEHFFSLPMAVEDLGRRPIYGSLDSMEMDKYIADSTPANMTAGAVHSLPWNSGYPVFSALGSSLQPVMLSNNVDLDTYLAPWVPYFSNVDEMTQIMQSATSGN